jgi:hypothetical protein
MTLREHPLSANLRKTGGAKSKMASAESAFLLLGKALAKTYTSGLYSPSF